MDIKNPTYKPKNKGKQNSKNVDERFHIVNVKRVFMDNVETNEKLVEGRLATKKYRDIRLGDNIKFVCGADSALRKVIQISIYDSFEELLTKEGIEECLPGVDTISEGVSIYNSFYDFKSNLKVIAFRWNANDFGGTKVVQKVTSEQAKQKSRNTPGGHSVDSAGTKVVQKVTSEQAKQKSRNTPGGHSVDSAGTKVVQVKMEPEIEIVTLDDSGDSVIFVENAKFITGPIVLDDSGDSVVFVEDSTSAANCMKMELEVVAIKSEPDFRMKSEPVEAVVPIKSEPNRVADFRLKSEPVEAVVPIKSEPKLENFDKVSSENMVQDSAENMVQVSAENTIQDSVEQDSDNCNTDDFDTEDDSENSNQRKRSIRWISSGRTYKMPDELWNAIYRNGIIKTEHWTHYKNTIGDDFDKKWHCILILSHRNVGKSIISMHGKCKHDGCRRYHFKFNRKHYVSGESPAFSVRYSQIDVQHEVPLARQIRGATKEDYETKLKNNKPATVARGLVLAMDDDQFDDGNTGVLKSDDVLIKLRQRVIGSTDLAKEDFDDMKALQDETQEDKYIQKVISPFAVYMHSKIQYKVLKECHKRRKHPDEEVVGFLDATGNVVKVNKETSTHPVFYYPLLIPLKPDESDKHNLLFPVTDCLNSAHAAPNISGWLGDFNGEFIKECPSIHPTLHRIMTDFSYANFHGVLHTFQSMRIQQYIYLCYKFAIGLVDFSALRNITKLEMCKTHISKTFAQFVRKHFPSLVANKKTCYEQRFILEVICSMVMCRCYNVLKEIFRNMTIMILAKKFTPSVVSAKEKLIHLCTSDPILNGEVQATYKFDKLIQSDMDVMSECTTIYDFKESVLDLPIYESSSFYYDLKYIYDNVMLELEEDEDQRDPGTKEIRNSFHNANIIPLFMKQFGGILPFWTSLTIPPTLQRRSMIENDDDDDDGDDEGIEVEIKRSSNQNAESHMNIVKQLMSENQLTLGCGKIRPSRFVKLLRPLVESHAKRYLLKVRRSRLNHGPKTHKEKDNSKVKKKIVKHVIKYKGQLKKLKNKDSTSIKNSQESWSKCGLKSKEEHSYFNKSTLLSSSQVTIVKKVIPKARPSKSIGASASKSKTTSKRSAESSTDENKSTDSTINTKDASNRSADSSNMDVSNASCNSTTIDVSNQSILQPRAQNGESDMSRKAFTVEVPKPNNGFLWNPQYYFRCSQPSCEYVVAKIHNIKLLITDYRTLQAPSNLSENAMNYIFEYILPPTYVNLTKYANDIILGVDPLPFTIKDKLCYMPVFKNNCWHLYFINTKKRSFTYYNPCDVEPMNFSFFFEFMKVYNSSDNHKNKLRSDDWRKFDFESINTPPKPIDSGIYVISAAYRFITQKTLQDVQFNSDEFRLLLHKEVLQYSDDMQSVCLICGEENDNSTGTNIDWSMCHKCQRWIHDSCLGRSLGDEKCPPCSD